RADARVRRQRRRAVRGAAGEVAGGRAAPDRQATAGGIHHGRDSRAAWDRRTDRPAQAGADPLVLGERGVAGVTPLQPSRGVNVSDRELDRYEGMALADQVVIDRLCSGYEMALRGGEDPSLEVLARLPAEEQAAWRKLWADVVKLARCP